MAVTNIYWPSQLPQQPVYTDGYRERFPENLHISNTTETGPPIDRPRSSAFFRPIFIPLVVKTDAELDIFEDFYFLTLRNGTQPFNWLNWVRKGSSVFRFDLSNPPDPEPMGNGVHRISFTLLQYPSEAL